MFHGRYIVLALFSVRRGFLNMKLFLYVPVYALAIAGLCVAVAPANAAGCNQLVGTADGWDKSDALSGSQAALAQEVNDFKKGKGAVTLVAMKARPRPYWRESVSDDLYVKPDVVTANSYTVCWHGVISPVVCTSGAKVCW
jgi:hypothetical protein